MEITQKFVERYFGDDFQCLYATHDNTQHVHSHILFNSVSWRTGKKYRYEKGDWAKEIQPIVNELCKEYGLSIQDIEIGTKEKEPKKWDKTKQGIFRWNRQISLDVENSISFANSYEDFLKLMEIKGYGINQNNGKTFLKPMGGKRFISLTDISEHYAKEFIERQIERGVQYKSGRTENYTPRIIGCRKNYKKYMPQTPYQKAFFAKMYRTGQLKRKPYSQMWRYKEEAARFEKLQSQYLYLCRHNIRSAGELEKQKKNLAIRMDDLDEARHKIYKKRYPYKPALALLKIIEENEIRASYYKQGSLFYAPNYEKWKEAAEILIQKGYTVSQISEMKETFQAEFASVAKAKRELKKEENLVNGILSEKSRIQAMEIKAPEVGMPYKAQENIRESDTVQKVITDRKGGGAGKADCNSRYNDMPASTNAGHMEKQPAYDKDRKQPEQEK